MSYSNLDYLVYLLLIVSTVIFARLLLKVLFSSSNQSSKFTGAEGVNERPLDSLECLLDDLHTLGGGNICVVLCLESRSPLSDDLVRQALATLCKRQPMLRTVIVRKSQGRKTEKYFKVLPQDQMNIEIQRSNVGASNWAQIWTKTVTAQFDTTKGPLWRANILQEEFRPEMKTYLNTILFVFSHSILDGISSLKFSEQFLCNLNAITNGCLMNEVESFPLLPSAVKLVSHKMKWPQWQRYLGLPQLSGMLLRLLIRLHIFRAGRNPFYLLYPPISGGKAASKPMIEVCELTTKETSDVMAACESHGSTVHCAILTACNIAFTKLIDAPYEEKFKSENSSSISLSRDCSPKVPDDYLGNFITEMRMKLPSVEEQQDFWTLAKRTTNQLHEKLKCEMHLKECVAVIETVGREFFASELLSSPDPEIMMRISSCFSLSNPGRFVWKEGDDQKFKLTRCFFTTASHRSTYVCSHFVVTVNGKLSWIICYNDAMVHAKQAKEFLRLSVHELLNNSTKAD